MEKRNIRLIIAYDGKAYLGWQKTPVGNSIEQTLQSTIEKILQEKISLQAASRTDAGVHAQGQVVNFFTTKSDLQLERFNHSVNCVLPRDIVVMSAEFAEEKFHPTLDCTGKEYRYSICYGSVQLPHHREYSWHYPSELDIDLMTEAGKILVGTHDFGAFCNMKKNEVYSDYIRTVTGIELLGLSDKRLQVEVKGTNFLYKMVRNIVGTLVYVGTGKITLAQLTNILERGDRTQAGMTAPAHGLCLHKVFYGNKMKNC